MLLASIGFIATGGFFDHLGNKPTRLAEVTLWCSPCLDSSEDIFDDSISNPQTSLSFCAPRFKGGRP